MAKSTKKKSNQSLSKAVEKANATNHRLKTGARLLDAFTALGKKQTEIAEEFTVSTSRLGHWVRGRHYPDPYFLFLFCQKYSVTTDWIYRGVVFGLPASLADDLSQRTSEFLVEPTE